MHGPFGYQYVILYFMWGITMQGKKAWLDSGKWIIFVIYKLYNLCAL